MEIICFRKDQGYTFENGDKRTVPILIPAFQSEFEKMKKVKHGEQVIINMKLSRKLEYLRQFWGISNFVFDNLSENYKFKTIGLFIEYVKLEVEFTEVCIIRGERKEYPRSMSFAECDELDFIKNLYNPALELYGNIMGMTRDELINASLEYSGIDHFNKRII